MRRDLAVEPDGLRCDPPAEACVMLHEQHGGLVFQQKRFDLHNHCYKDVDVPIKEQGFTTAPVSIGKHCWIGSNVVILKGVTIGDNCVIGAGCVVYKDVPSGSIVVNKQNLLYKH